jgi:hypothetical protein
MRTPVPYQQAPVFVFHPDQSEGNPATLPRGLGQTFAELTHILRKANARSVDTICAVIDQILRAFTPEECANHFRTSGYSPT